MIPYFTYYQTKYGVLVLFFIKKCLVGALFLTISFQVSAASTFRIGHSAGYDFSSITAGLQHSNPGDTLILEDGNYSVQTGEFFPIHLPNGVKIMRENPLGLPHIIGDRNSTLLLAQDATDLNTTVNGLWLSGGIGYTTTTLDSPIPQRYGGALAVIHSNVKVKNCLFTDSEADCGGAIAASNEASISIYKSFFRGLISRKTGGGIWTNRIKKFSLEEAVFEENSSLSAGGSVFCEFLDSLLIIGGIFEDSSSGGSGGALFCGQALDAVIQDSEFSRNQARVGGGGAYFGNGFGLHFLRCTFRNNVAKQGGGIRIGGSPQLLVEKSIFFQNTASEEGGAVFTVTTSAQNFNNCVFWKNEASDGGAVRFLQNPQANMLFQNCSIVGNRCANLSGSGGLLNEGHFVGTVVNSILWNNIYNNTKSFPGPFDINWCVIQPKWPTGNNLDTDPLLVDVSRGNLHLLPGAPCIDVGTNRDAPPTDFEGESRPNPNTGLVDIGADEFYQGYVTPTFTETPTPDPTETPSPTPTATGTSKATETPTTTPTAATLHPSIALAGYWTTTITRRQGGTFQMLALSFDADRVEIAVGGIPAGVVLPAVGSDGLFWLQGVPIGPGVPPQRLPLELLAFKASQPSTLWPYLNVE